MEKKFDSMEPGMDLEMDAHDENGKETTIRFQIIETGYYPSPTKKPVFVRGVKCRFEDGTEDIVFFLSLIRARKVKDKN